MDSIIASMADHDSLRIHLHANNRSNACERRLRPLQICLRLAWLALLATSLSSLPAYSQVVDASTLKGKVLLGYQGWFRCPAGGPSGSNWSHWANGTPSAATLQIDMYPDFSEFDRDELCSIPNMTIGAAPAYLFSSGNSKTVARHFQWMRDYGLDGVLVQRFVTDIPGLRSAGDVVLRNIIASAAQYGRAFAIEYDISGANAATVANVLQQDWQYLVTTLGITDRPGYLYERGKPVLSVWGIGLNDTRHPPTDPGAALELIEWFRSTAQVAYVGGTPAYWRGLSNDSWTDARWRDVYKAMDVIQPWTVGRYSDIPGVDRWKTSMLDPDFSTTSSNGQLYMPVIFPGFSWYNLNRTARQNQIPRNGGDFLWKQAYNVRTAGAQMLKIAMFDEVNEATAMFKLASSRQDAPDQGYWLTLDADGFILPSDWYLRLAGEITRAFRGQTSLSPVTPKNPGPPWPDATGKSEISIVSGASFIPGTLSPEAIATAIESRPATSSQSQASGTSAVVIDTRGVARPGTILYASPSQVNFIVPAGTAAGRASILIISGDGTVRSGGTVIEPIAPGLFSAGSNGQGIAAGVARLLHPDGTESSALTFSCLAPGNCAAVPIGIGAEGDVAVLELYGTGIRGQQSLSSVVCTIGETTARVLSAGPQSQYPGLDQVNVMIPQSLAGSGELEVRLTIAGHVANPVRVTIR